MAVKWAITIASIGAAMLGTANAQSGIDLALPTVSDQKPRVLFPQAVEADDSEMRQESMIPPLPTMETPRENAVGAVPTGPVRHEKAGDQELSIGETVTPDIQTTSPAPSNRDTNKVNVPITPEPVIALPEATPEREEPREAQLNEDVQPSSALGRFKAKMEAWKVNSNTSLANLEQIIGMQERMMSELAMAREAGMGVLPDNRLSRTICRDLELPGLCQELEGTFK